MSRVEHYYNESQAGKEVLPMLFSDGVISPKSLAALIARVFSYSILDLRHYPRHRVLMGVLTEEQMVEFHCVPVFRRGDKVFLRFPIRPRCRKFRKPFLPQGLRLSWSLSRMTSWRVCSIGWVRVRHRCFRSLGRGKRKRKATPCISTTRRQKTACSEVYP